MLTCARCGAPLNAFDCFFREGKGAPAECPDREACKLRAVREDARRDELELVRLQINLPGATLILKTQANTRTLLVAIGMRRSPVMVEAVR